MKSNEFSLNKTDWSKFGKDALWFFLVPMTFYISAVLGTIQEPNHILAVKDFIPTNTTMIVIVSWVLNQFLNLLRKYIA